MKKLLFAICGAAITFAGCKEYNTAIDFGSNVVTQNTHVVSPVPAADPHQVLVEEFTGQSCSNCPTAHANLDEISSQNPGRINVVSMYITGLPQTDPPAGSMHDFRDSIATIISGVAIYGGVDALPSAGIDRTVPTNGGLLQIGGQTWNIPIDTQLTRISPVNLLLTSSYDPAKNLATVTAVVTYTQPLSTPQNLSIVVVEDSIYDKQDTLGTVLNNYLFLDVFRGMVTSVPSGDVLQVTANSNAKEAGRVFQKVYSYPLPVKTPAIVPSHCRVIAFVNNTNGADKHVLQSAQCKLMQ